MKAREPLPKEVTKRFVAHRGANNESPNCQLPHLPENTLAALLEAYRVGTEFVECDIHITRDDQLIVLHDDTLRRTARYNPQLAKKMTPAQFEKIIDINVSDLTYDQLKQVDIGAYSETIPERFHGCPVPLLQDFLSELKDHPERKLVIEIKTGPTRILMQLQKLVRLAEKEFGLRTDQLHFISFDFNLSKECKVLLPEYVNMFLTTATPDTDDAHYDPQLPEHYSGLYFRIKSEADLVPIIKLVKDANLDGIDFEYDVNVNNESFVQRIHQADLVSAVWTNLKDDTLLEARQMLGLAVRYINTNQPEAIFAALKNDLTDAYFFTRAYHYIGSWFTAKKEPEVKEVEAEVGKYEQGSSLTR